MTRLVLTIAAAILLGSATQVPAQAAPITYTLTTTATGTLGAKSFTNAVVTVTLTGDTSNVTAGPAPYTDVWVNSGAATVSVVGIGTGTFTDSIQIICTLNDAAALGVAQAVLILDNTTGTGILAQTGSAFSSYDLRSPLGPLSGTGGVASGSHMTPIFPTTAGNLTWAIGQSFGTSTFTAIPAFFTGQVSVGSGVEYLQFPNSAVFGYYTVVSSPILYHFDLGYEAFVPGSASDAYLYDFTTGHWWYTSNTLFPYLYDFTLNAWLYYYPNPSQPGHYTSNPRDFYNFATGQIITL